MTEVHLLFYQSALQSFVHFNMFLQRDDPIIFLLCDQITKFMKTLLGKFINVAVIKESKNDKTQVDSFSNAEEKRVFSMINKNKTKFRPNLKLDGTLSNILTVKPANPESLQPCHKYEPARRIFKTAKKATMEYNKIHSSSHSMSSSTLPSSSNLPSSSS